MNLGGFFAEKLHRFFVTWVYQFPEKDKKIKRWEKRDEKCSFEYQ